ncbi:TPA: preprotein translocase subunit SecG [Candidatus Saccharibacteria bacterium]|nr:preprotein translocase subunit SecG [Candidatus Saccharibacteria bacterium]HIO87655.1 preprotein translocase subunit SecG [Candidatus Saccharibacteria bacterium]
MEDILRAVTVISGVLMTVFILVQGRGASLGAGFGGSNEIHTERRGVDKTIHQITIVLAVAFSLSILLNLILG